MNGHGRSRKADRIEGNSRDDPPERTRILTVRNCCHTIVVADEGERGESG
jgi:hypothetical protein